MMIRRKLKAIEAALKYSPEQPRDDRGRWNAVSVSGEGSESKTDLSSPIDRNDSIRVVGLKGLAAEARKCQSFDEFQNDYQLQIKHGLYWHITYDEEFSIDSEKGPHDASSIATGQMDKGKLMITSDLPAWAGPYGSSEQTGGKPRGYAAIIDMTKVDRKNYRQVSRGFGNEFFVSDTKDVGVVKTVSLREAKRLDRQYQTAKPQSAEELKQFYDRYGSKQKEKYAPDQPRDSHGRWSAGSGSGTGSESKTGWNVAATEAEANVQFLDKFNIRECTGTMPHINSAGEHLQDLCDRFPKVQEILKKGAGLGRLEMQNEKDVYIDNQTQVGWGGGWDSRPPFAIYIACAEGKHTVFGGSDPLDLLSPSFGKNKMDRVFNYKEKDIGKVTYTAAIEDTEVTYEGGHIVPSHGISHVRDNINHEVGHQLLYCLGENETRAWETMLRDTSKLKENNVGVIEYPAHYLATHVSEYAGAVNMSALEKERYPLASKAQVQLGKYTEGFAESFAKYANPNYKTGDLPAPIYDHLNKLFGGKK
jgi:hypothetical protein